MHKYIICGENRTENGKKICLKYKAWCKWTYKTVFSIKKCENNTKNHCGKYV